jgi:hypothetical protein
MSKLKWWLINHLPRWAIGMAIVRAVSFATSGKYSKTFAGELSAMELLKRWEAQ